MKKIVKRFIQKYRNTFLLRKINQYGSALSRILNCENTTCDLLYNGEYHLMKLLATEDSEEAMVFDVGANRGEWAQAWLDLTKLSSVYCFEVAEPTYAKLLEAFQGNARVSCLPFGLSDKDAETTVAYIPSSDSGSSLNVLPWQKEMEALPAVLKTGDCFAKESGINRIFFLKIDTEGHELNVLKGLTSMIEEQRIKCIQFEYGYTYIQNRHFLKDVYELLENAGYSLGRIYPEGVDFKKYDIFRDEDFRMKNYFATCDSAIQKKVGLSRRHKINVR